MDVDGDLTRGIVEPVVLKLVSERPMYGYEIIKVVKERSSETFQWKEGSLYPCLHRLEGAGLIKSEWRKADSGRKRKYYVTTRKGEALLSEKMAAWQSFSHAVDSILSAMTGAEVSG